jgi:AcrR family transcriptional regulator
MNNESIIIPEEKQKIILYARERFLAEGFAKITIDEIAKELFISKSTFYKYFSNKDILIQESIASVVGEISARVKLMLESDSNAIEKFTGMMVILTKNIIRFSNKFFNDLQFHAPHIWEQVDEIRKKLMFDNISRIIKQGQEEKLFIDYPPEIILGLFIGALRNVVSPEFLLNNRFSGEEAAKTCFHICINGILTEKGKKVYNQSTILK